MAQSQDIENYAKDMGIEIDPSLDQEGRFRQIADALGMEDYNGSYDELEKKLAEAQSGDLPDKLFDQKNRKPKNTRDATMDTNNPEKGLFPGRRNRKPPKNATMDSNNPGRGFFASRSKNGRNANGYQGQNNSRGQASSNSTKNAQSLSDKIKNVRREQQRKQARQNIRKGLNSYMPGLGEVANKKLKTEQGEKLLDKYLDAPTKAEGIRQVAKELTKEKRRRKMIFWFLTHLIPIFLLLLLLVLIFKNADTQIFSNQNGGTVESEYYEFDNVNTNIFANYPGLYEKIVSAVKKVSDTYKIEVDQYIILATLLAPIDNGYVTPVRKEDITTGNACDEDLCYKYDGDYITWQEFVDTMGEEAELLAKMQILTFTIKGECGSEKTMEQYAKNDDEVEELAWWEWLNPVRWFTGYTDEKKAEKNYVCVDAPQKDNRLPENVYTLSLDKGEYKYVVHNDGTTEYEKDPNSGGVYYWNLVNEGGFLFKYLKDYLYDDNHSITDESELYKLNLPTILSNAEYIYSYYLSIRKSCDYPDDVHKILKSEIKTIKVYNPPEKQSRFGLEEHIEIDFEDQYIGGVMLAEYNSGNDEALKAFAILARTEAVANVGLDGSGEIENSSNKQNYNPNYSKEKYPRIAAAVEATRGLVVSDYKKQEVWHTEYDAFCPTSNTPEGGRWYYLPEGQQNLPIDIVAYEEKTGKQFIDPDSKYLDCPCFKNANSRPHDEVIDRKYIKYSTYDQAPTEADGTPSQTTKESCWTRTSYMKDDLVGWSYKASGGHGRGASQYGLTYFGAFGYDQDALIRLFFKTAQLRVLQSSLPEGKCHTVDTMDLDKDGGNTPSGNSDFDGNGYTEILEGSPLKTTLVNALAAKGHTIEDLNSCIGEKVNSAGYGTRAGVVAAGVGLLQCTMDLTGGYTYPYDHTGGKVWQADLNGKLGVNSKWGEYGGVGCKDEPCRLGLNCANFVRWALCNGGMNLCSQGSAFAHEMIYDQYYPGLIKIKTAPFFKVISGETDISTSSDAFDQIKPGDVLYSNSVSGGSNHVMLIVGKEDDRIIIAENGRKTRAISKSAITSSGGSMEYIVLLLDGYYNDPQNQNGLSW